MTDKKKTTILLNMGGPKNLEEINTFFGEYV